MRLIGCASLLPTVSYIIWTDLFTKKCVLAFSDELPDGFSNVLKQEEDKVREKFDETLHAKKLEPDAAEDTQDTEANLKSSLNLVTWFKS